MSTQPVFILREALQHLTQQRLVAPGYRFLQEMVGRVVAGERKRLTHLLGQALTPVVAQQCDALLEAGERLDRISTLKHEPKDFSYTELRREVARRQFFQPLYAFAQTFLLTTGLSNESVKYYASLVQFYTVYKLQRMARPMTRLYLLCFAFHRFRQINDTLTEAFIHLIDHYEKQAKQAAQDAMQRAMTETNADLHAAGDVLRLFVDASIPAMRRSLACKSRPSRCSPPSAFRACLTICATSRSTRPRASGRVTPRCRRPLSVICAMCSVSWTSPAVWKMRRCWRPSRSSRPFYIKASRRDKPHRQRFPPPSFQRAYSATCSPWWRGNARQNAWRSIGMSFWCIVSCATRWRRVMCTSRTVRSSAVSKTT